MKVFEWDMVSDGGSDDDQNVCYGEGKFLWLPSGFIYRNCIISRLFLLLNDTTSLVNIVLSAAVGEVEFEASLWLNIGTGVAVEITSDD